MSGTGEEKQSLLLADIEEFSRSGPRISNEPAKPELHRETLAFPDLTKAGVPPVAKASPCSVASAGVAPVREAAAQPLDSPSTNSLLARLKQQAETLQQDASQKGVTQDILATQLSISLGNAFHYLDDLIKQLNIIKPAIPKEFLFPGNIAFSGMSWVEGAADFRMVPGASDNRRFESLTVRFRIASAKKLSVEREIPHIEPLRKTLHDYNIVFSVDERMNLRNQAEKARFTFPCEIKGGFLIKADYEAGDLVLRTRNIDRFGMMEFRLKTPELNQQTLDELTKLFLGDKSEFMKMFRRTA